MDNKLSIGKLSEATGVPARTIRYYEEAGILPVPERSESGYRLYSETDVRRLDLIRRARALNMTLAEVRELVVWAGCGTRHDFQARFLEMVRRKLEEVDRRVADLEQLKLDLRRLEAHFVEAENEVKIDHTVLECSPETCTCLRGTRGAQERRQEVKLWLNQSRAKS